MASPIDDSDRNDGGSTRHAYSELRELILEGELEAGAVLSQVQLAGSLGVSRTPLREAIRRLEQEGLLRSEPNRRVRVSPVSVEDLEELFAARILLEALGVRLTLPALTDEDVQRVEGHLSEFVEALGRLDHAAVMTLHRRFRHALFAGAGTRLEPLILDLYAHAERYRRLYLLAADEDLALHRLAVADYEALAAAARARDGQAGSTVVARHLARTALRLIAAIDPGYDPRKIRAALTPGPAAS